MLFDQLVTTSSEVAATRSRLKKTSILTEFLSQLDAEELLVAVKFLCGELRQGKIGIGGATIRKTLKALPRESDRPPLSIVQLDQTFSEIAGIKGSGSTKRRAERLEQLFLSTDDAGRSFLARLLMGEIRQGAVEGVMIESIAQTMELESKDVRRAAMLSGDLSRVAAVAKSEGAAGISEFSLELFRPVQPMLAEPSEDISAAIERLGEAVLEYKLDGVRIQVHKDGDQVRVFTRHLKEVTSSVPEVVDLIRSLRTNRLILDGEVLALREDGRPHPFQTTMRRFGRTREIDQLRVTLPLSMAFFDCLLLEQQPLIDLSTAQRHEAMAEVLDDRSIIPRLVTADSAAAEKFLSAAMDNGHEGVMAKSLDAEYTAGGRGQSWLKIKPSHTLDLVVLAAEWGSGRRKGWLSNLHLGARSDNQFAMIGKTFKGLTDQTLKWQTEMLLSLETGRDDYTVFVKPALVVEIAFNEVQASSHYESGFALRFARVKRYRDDKSVSEADTLATVEKLFKAHRE